MSTFKTVSIRLQANVGEFRAQMAAASTAVRSLGSEVSRTANAHSQLGKAVGIAGLGIGAAMVAGFGMAVKSAIDFEREMRNVNSISHLSEGALSSLSRQVVDMSRDLPQSASTLAAGLYDVASSGFQGADGLTVLKASAIAASAGLTDTATSAKSIVAVLNAYGKSASDATDVSDTLFEGVNVGVLTFGELASSLGDVVGAAAAAGVPIDAVTSALATMTLSGISAAEASTSLGRVIQGFVKPSDTMAETIRRLGFESGVAMLQTLGLRGSIDALRKATGGSVTAVVDLFNEIRGARGAFALMSDGGNTYARVADQIEDKSARAGAAQRALAEQSKSVSYQFQVAKNSIGALGIQMTQALLPVLRTGAEFLKSLNTGFAELPGPIRLAAAGLAGLVAVVAIAGGGFLVFRQRIIETRAAMLELQASGSALPGVMTAVGTGVGLATVALTIGAIALAAHAASTAKAKAETEAFVAALKDEAAGTKGALDAHVAEQLERKGALKLLSEYAITSGQAVKAVEGEQAAVRGLAEAMEAQLPAAVRTEKAHKLLVDALNGSNDAAQDLYSALVVAGEGGNKAANDIVATAKKVGDLSDRNSEAAKSLQRTTQAQQGATEATDDGTRAVQQQLKALDDAQKAREEWTQSHADMVRAVAGFTAPFASYQALLKAKQDKEEEAARTLAKATRGGEEDWKRFAKEANVSLGEYATGLEQQITSMTNWRRNLLSISQNVGADVAEQFADMGVEAAPLVEQFVKGTLAEQQRLATDLRTITKQGSQDAAYELSRGFDAMQRLAQTGGGKVAKALVDSFAAGKIPLATLVSEYTALLASAVGAADLLAQQLTTAYRNIGRAAPPLVPTIPVPSAPGLPVPALPGKVPPRARAAGGIDAHVVSSAHLLYGERSTGSEAFVPRIGDHGRALATLNHAAGWHGARVVKMARGGIVGRYTEPMPRYAVNYDAQAATEVRALGARFDRLSGVLEARRPVAVSQTFNEKIDPLHAAHATAWVLD